MDENDLQDLLLELLEEAMSADADDEDDPLAEYAARAVAIRRVRTYADEDMLTSDKGLVVRMDDGSEYQLSIVRSR